VIRQNGLRKLRLIQLKAFVFGLDPNTAEKKLIWAVVYVNDIFVVCICRNVELSSVQ
jgi:hypothetical protein